MQPSCLNYKYRSSGLQLGYEHGWASRWRGLRANLELLGMWRVGCVGEKKSTGTAAQTDFTEYEELQDFTTGFWAWFVFAESLQMAPRSDGAYCLGSSYKVAQLRGTLLLHSLPFCGDQANAILISSLTLEFKRTL